MDKKHFKILYNSLGKKLLEDEKINPLSALKVENGFSSGFSDQVMEEILIDKLENGELFFSVIKNQFRGFAIAASLLFATFVSINLLDDGDVSLYSVFGIEEIAISQAFDPLEDFLGE